MDVLQVVLAAGVVVMLLTILVIIYLVFAERAEGVRQRQAADAFFAAQRQRFAARDMAERDIARPRVDQRAP
jgi:hypothetical protein